MRVVYDPNGTDVTSTVQAFLKANRTLYVFNLYRFETVNFWHYNPSGDLCDFTFTDAPFPIHVNKYQAFGSGAVQLGTFSGQVPNTNGLDFMPDNFKRGTFEYGIGFDSQSTEVQWFIDDSIDYQGSQSGGGLSVAVSPVGLTMRRAMLLGCFDDCPFWIHRAFFDGDPRLGGNFLGTTCMFRGSIRGVEAAADHLKLTIESLMSTFQSAQVPTQLITPNSRSAPYAPVAGGTYSGAWDTVGTIYSETVMDLQRHIIGAAGVPAHALQDYWISFSAAGFAGDKFYGNGRPSGPLFRIRDNDDGMLSSRVKVYFYTAPVIPTNTLLVNVFGQSDLGSGSPGFPNVPPPEVSV